MRRTTEARRNVAVRQDRNRTGGREPAHSMAVIPKRRMPICAQIPEEMGFLQARTRAERQVRQMRAGMLMQTAALNMQRRSVVRVM